MRRGNRELLTLNWEQFQLSGYPQFLISDPTRKNATVLRLHLPKPCTCLFLKSAKSLLINGYSFVQQALFSFRCRDVPAERLHCKISVYRSLIKWPNRVLMPLNPQFWGNKNFKVPQTWGIWGAKYFRGLNYMQLCKEMVLEIGSELPHTDLR